MTTTHVATEECLSSTPKPLYATLWRAYALSPVTLLCSGRNNLKYRVACLQSTRPYASSERLLAPAKRVAPCRPGSTPDSESRRHYVCVTFVKAIDVLVYRRHR